MGTTSETRDRSPWASASQNPDDAPRAWHWVALIAGNMALALGPWSVRLADSGPVAAGFWRLALALPIIWLIARRAGQPVLGVPRRIAFLVALGALAFAFDLASWHIGIEQTRLGNATLFGNAGSIVLLFWGIVVARTMPARAEWAAIILALGGAAILLGRSAEISASTLVGDLFCITAGFLYAVYLLCLQDARKTLGSWGLLARVCLVAAPVLLFVALLRGEPVWPRDWTPLLVLAILSQVIGQGLLVFALRAFPPMIIGLALLTQPAVAVGYGFLAFGEVLGPLDLVGMAMVGAALAVARARTG
ncbi:DMT family transporter [Alteriqipengyuania lutimaris]|uniref:DMT family transporter n=2 Tax=Alteriqipengyuania lutimaris TaxID=1538146 RepID=A0A395LKB3_9SPHN|nr:DMT family transporter [Alteriqipengyuania lutimaris]